jgi:hypothetical protein
MMSSDTNDNFDTMMETPNALRFVSQSFHSEAGDGKRRKKGKNSKLGNQAACCGGGNESGGGCMMF